MEFLDYTTLKFIWWALVGVLWLGFALTEGFDMGVSMLIPIIGKTDSQRRVMINCIAPHWDGNQVWLVLAAGALFAVWPTLYATAFSGLYPAMMLILIALIIRPVAMDYRSKLDNKTWRSTWDWLFIIPGLVPPLLLGVTMGNLFLGLPFEFDEYMRSTYSGSFLGLLHPFALLAGILAVAMFLMQGSSFLALRSEGVIRERAQKFLSWSGFTVVVLFVVEGIWLYKNIDGLSITGYFDPGGVSNPMLKTVQAETGGWLQNYSRYPLSIIAPVMGVLGAIAAMRLAHTRHMAWAFFASSISLVGIILTAGFSLFPFIMPSSTEINHSLTMWDATSSHLTLTVSFWAAVIFMPMILAYNLFSYIKMWRTYTVEFIRDNDHSLY